MAELESRVSALERDLLALRNALNSLINLLTSETESISNVIKISNDNTLGTGIDPNTIQINSNAINTIKTNNIAMKNL